MTIASNVISILNLATTIRANQIQEIIPKLAALQTAIDAIKLELTPPETGNFNPPPSLMRVVNMEVPMSVAQMTVGDPPRSGKLTFSEPGAPANGAVASDNPVVASISLDPTDHVTWTITLAAGGGPGVCNITYTGTSDPPDSGPVIVEPLVLTVVAVPPQETGQFNP